MNFSLEVETDEDTHRFSTFLSRDTAASCIEFARKTGGVGPNGYTKRNKRESSVRAKALLRKAERAQGRRPLRAAAALLATGAALFVGAQQARALHPLIGAVHSADARRTVLTRDASFSQAGLQPEAHLRELRSRCRKVGSVVRTEVQRRLPSPAAASAPSSEVKKTARA